MKNKYEQIENTILINDYQQAKTLIKQLKNKYVSDLLSEIAEIEAVYKQIGEV